MLCYAMSCLKLPLSPCKQIQSLLGSDGMQTRKRRRCAGGVVNVNPPNNAGELGFKEIKAFNDAMLAKIGCRIIQDPNSLISQMLMGKYGRNCYFLEFPAPASASHIWRNILAGRQVLHKGLGWIVGNGEIIRVWGWPMALLLATYWSYWIFGSPTFETSSMRVSDLDVQLPIHGISRKFDYIYLSMRSSSWKFSKSLLLIWNLLHGFQIRRENTQPRQAMDAFEWASQPYIRRDWCNKLSHLLIGLKMPGIGILPLRWKTSFGRFQLAKTTPLEVSTRSRVLSVEGSKMIYMCSFTALLQFVYGTFSLSGGGRLRTLLLLTNW